MKFFYSPTSPFVRKCLVVAHELGVQDRLQWVPGAAHPINRDPSLVACNPLGQVPTLITDDGLPLYDSRVICEYLNTRVGGTLFPSEESLRWRALAEQSLADGMTNAAVLTRYETALRPAPLQWSEWIAGQLDKVHCGLSTLERDSASFAGRIDIGTIAIGCALAYLDFRYASLRWRDSYPALNRWLSEFASRPSMMATRPP